MHLRLNGEGDVGGVVVTVEQVAQALVAAGQRAADEVSVEGTLGAVGPEGERQVARDRRVQLAFGVLPLALELVVDLDRPGDHDAVRGLDRRRARR